MNKARTEEISLAADWLPFAQGFGALSLEDLFDSPEIHDSGTG
jgi:hypothetical protein